MRIAMLVAVWLALWGDVSAANLASGALVAAAVVASTRATRSGQVIVRPLRALHLAAVFAWMLVTATVSTAAAVLAPARRVHTGIIAVPLRGCSDVVATVIADAITLTPGTLSIELHRDDPTSDGDPVLYVHALDLRDLDAVVADVRRLEVLAIRAFGDDDALAGSVEDDTRSWEAT